MLNCLWPCGVLAKLSVYLLVINKTRGVMCENSRLLLCRRDLHCGAKLRILPALIRTQPPRLIKSTLSLSY